MQGRRTNARWTQGISAAGLGWEATRAQGTSKLYGISAAPGTLKIGKKTMELYHATGTDYHNGAFLGGHDVSRWAESVILLCCFHAVG